MLQTPGKDLKTSPNLSLHLKMKLAKNNSYTVKPSAVMKANEVKIIQRHLVQRPDEQDPNDGDFDRAEEELIQ